MICLTSNIPFFWLRWSKDIDGLTQNLADEQARFSDALAADDTDIAAVIVGEVTDLIRTRELAHATLSGMISQAEDRLRHIGRLVEPITLDWDDADIQGEMVGGRDCQDKRGIRCLLCVFSVCSRSGTVRLNRLETALPRL